MCWMQIIKNMKKPLIIAFLFITISARSQVLTLDSIYAAIVTNYPMLKSYDAEIRSLDESAKGAHNWEAPQLSTGLWMTPYDPSLWKRQSNGSTGMGQYMISAEQMFPNKNRQDAEEKYMLGKSSVEKEKKSAAINELYAAAKQNFYQWVVLKKKLAVLHQDSLLLDFMIKSTEIRYKNNLGKISAYYKVKASLGNIESVQLSIENDIVQKRVLLNTLMNRDKSAVFDIDTAFAIRSYNQLVTDSISFKDIRSDIRAVESNIQLISLEQNAELGKLKPEFGIRYDNMFGFGGFPMQYSLMGTVKLPMAKWSSKAAKANVESLKWKAESLNQQKQTMINDASGESFAIQRSIVSKQKQIKLYEENIIPALLKNFQTMQLSYEENTEELFTLYDAWQTLDMTQLEYLDQLKELVLMQVELDRILEIK
jgi:outer membrane protein, heavy metal efflux system